MNEQLAFAPLDYSIGASLFFLSYLALHVPAAIIVHRIGARRGLAFMLVAWGSASCCMAFVSTRAAFYTVRLSLGVAETGFYPAVTLYLTHWHASSAMGVNFSIIAASTTLAGVLGGPLATALMSATDGMGTWAGWRWMYVAEALPAVMYIALPCLSRHPSSLTRPLSPPLTRLGAVLYFRLPDGPNDQLRCPWLTPPLRRAVLTRIARAVAAVEGNGEAAGVGYLKTVRLCAHLLRRRRLRARCRPLRISALDDLAAAG
jgi:MFS family permease